MQKLSLTKRPALGHRTQGEDDGGVPLEGLTGSPDIDETMSRTGRRIQASAKKQGRKSGKQD